MAGRSKRRATAAKNEARATPERRVPHVKVIEMGEWEQGEEERIPRNGGRGEHLQEEARERLREGERHGGLPIGADPRE